MPKPNREFGYGGNMYNLSGVSDLSKAVKIYSSGRLYYFGWCPFCVRPYERIEQQFWGWRV